MQTLETIPAGATHCSTRSMAKACGPSAATVSRIWCTFGLKPHRCENFKLSRDPPVHREGTRHRGSVPASTRACRCVVRGREATEDLEEAIEECLNAHNANPKPFIWTKNADQILESLKIYCERFLKRDTRLLLSRPPKRTLFPVPWHSRSSIHPQARRSVRCRRARLDDGPPSDYIYGVSAWLGSALAMSAFLVGWYADRSRAKGARCRQDCWRNTTKLMRVRR